MSSLSALYPPPHLECYNSCQLHKDGRRADRGPRTDGRLSVCEEFKYVEQGSHNHSARATFFHFMDGKASLAVTPRPVGHQFAPHRFSSPTQWKSIVDQLLGAAASAVAHLVLIFSNVAPVQCCDSWYHRKEIIFFF